MNSKKYTQRDNLTYQNTMALWSHLSSERYNESALILLETPGLIDPNFEIDKDWRLIDSCIYEGALHAPEILALVGANITLKNKVGLLPYEFALTRGFPKDSYTMDVLAGRKNPRPLNEILNEFYDLVHKQIRSCSASAMNSMGMRP